MMFDNLCLVAGERFERPSSSCRVSAVAVEGLYLLSYPASWGGLLAFLPGLIYEVVIQRITAVFDSACDPESAAGNSSGS